MANPSNNVPITVDSNGRTRVIDALGRQSIKGGQTVDSNLFDSIFNSYACLIYHPFALCCLVIGLFIFFAESNGSNGPLEIIAHSLGVAAVDPSYPTFVRGLFNVLFAVFHFLVAYKLVVGKLCLILVTYIAKPSTRNLVFSVIVSFIALFKLFSYLELFVLTQLFFLFSMVRNPRLKLAFIVLFVAIFVAEFININDLHAHVNKLAQNMANPPGHKIRHHGGGSKATPAPVTKSGP